MNKKLTALGVTAGLAAGGLGGLILAVPAISGAQTPTTQSADASALSAPAGVATPADRPDPATHIADVLKPLVDNGTITQAQADAVTAALAADHQAHEGDQGKGGPGGPRSEVLAQALGMSEADLHTALESGKTIAQVAADQGQRRQAADGVGHVGGGLVMPARQFADVGARVGRSGNDAERPGGGQPCADHVPGQEFLAPAHPSTSSG